MKLLNIIQRITLFFYHKKEQNTAEKAIKRANNLYLLDRHKRKYIVLKAVKGNFIVCRKQDINKDTWRKQHFKNSKKKDVIKYIIYETI